MKAPVAELVDAHDLKSCCRMAVPVRLRPGAPTKSGSMKISDLCRLKNEKPTGMFMAFFNAQSDVKSHWSSPGGPAENTQHEKKTILFPFNSKYLTPGYLRLKIVCT